MPKIEPMVTATSMFDEPSTGSICTMYACAAPLPPITGFSISSLPTAATLPLASSASTKMSDPAASSFWTASPWTFVSPVAPSTPARAAACTCSCTMRAPPAMAPTTASSPLRESLPAQDASMKSPRLRAVEMGIGQPPGAFLRGGRSASRWQWYRTTHGPSFPLWRPDRQGIVSQDAAVETGASVRARVPLTYSP